MATSFRYKRPRGVLPSHQSLRTSPAMQQPSTSTSLSTSASVALVLVLCSLVRSTASDPTCGSEFHPLPGTQVQAGCKWEIRLNTVLNRIPSTITEIFCRSPNSTCGGHSHYQCRQIRAKMVVAYTDQSDASALTLLHRQNITFSLGCSCVLTRPNVLNFG